MAQKLRNMQAGQKKWFLIEGFFELAFPLLTRFTEESFVYQIVVP